MASRVTVAAALVALLLTSGCGLWSGETHDLTGVINVMDMHIRAAGTPCAGARPFLYVRTGAGVVVRDLEGNVLAEGEIGQGEAINAHEPLAHLARAPTFCRLEWEVRGLPLADTYEVQFGDGHTVTFDLDVLEDNDWFAEVVMP